MAKNMVTEVRKDLKVLQVLVEHDGPITEPVLSGLWRWFLDVELMLPLPVMPLSEKERKNYALQIIQEMDATFVELSDAIMSASEDELGNISQHPLSLKVNDLWRELAGVYASIVNTSVTVLSDEEKEVAYQNALEMLMHTSGMEEDELRDRLRHDPTLRLMLRRSGLDPDRLY